MKQEIKERVERIRNGEVPEGYKATKVGIIPVDWTLDNLKIHVSSFIVPMRDKPKVFSGDIPWCRIEDFQGKYLEKSLSNQNVSKETIDEMNLKVYPKGTVLCSCSARLGICTIVKKPLVTNQTFIGLVPKEELDNEFLYYFMGFKCEKLQKLSSGTTISYLSREEFENFPITYTSIKEQKKIRSIISTWDKAIELKEKLIKEKNKLRIAIVTDLLFGLKRFDEFIKSHKYNSTKYTIIPEDWEFIKIGEIAIEVSEKNVNNDELPVLSCTKHSGLVDSLTYFKKRVFSEDTSTYKQVQKNQFVYATNHIDEGSIGCQNLYENSLVSPMYTVFKTNSKVNNDFLFSLLKTKLYIFIYQVNMSASVDRRGSLRWNEFSKIGIPLPDIAEQNKIVEFIKLINNEIDLLNKELTQLKEQKKGLMQLLLTGIVRVEVD